MNLKVVSDGTSAGTKVINVDTGEMLSGVKAVKWSISPDAILADVVMVLEKVPVELAATIKGMEKTKNEILPKQS